MLCPQTPRRNNQGLPVSKVRLLERFDSSPMIQPVARLPFGPVHLPDAIDYQNDTENNIIRFSVAGALKGLSGHLSMFIGMNYGCDEYALALRLWHVG